LNHDRENTAIPFSNGLLASTREECDDIEALARAELSKLGLELSKQKTETRAPGEPVEFLGMELSLKPGASTYGLTVSKEQLKKIREQFTNFHDLDFAMKEGLDLPKLLRRLENMKSGYRTAYSVADNFELLDQNLEQWAANCIVKVYTSIFDYKSIEKLSKIQRRFLLLPH
jgi:hypothetical protein